MKEFNIFIMPGRVYSKPVEYMLKVIAHNQQVKFNFVDINENAALIFDVDDPERTVPIAVDFYRSLLEDHHYDHRHHFQSDFTIRTGDSRIDYLAQAFYMINCFQEYAGDQGMFDKFGRFHYEKSYQHEYDNISENLVQDAIDKFCTSYLKGHALRKTRSRLFISHDIDTIHGALFQDGYWALKHRRPDIIFKIIVHALLLGPDWKNMDKIMKINDEYDIKSTFFWLVNKGKGTYGIKNADYRARCVKSQIQRIEDNGFFNGLHKSCSNDSIQEEIKKFPMPVRYNRFHFLRFSVPDFWEQLELSGIEMDCSLGFAQHYGFRNNYGLPFKPYDPKTQTIRSIIEVPLNLMDSTFSRYMKVPISETAEKVIGFLEKNRFNCILSLLWHNTYFTDYKYKGYLEEYKKILGYLHEANLNPVTPTEIIDEFSSLK